MTDRGSALTALVVENSSAAPAGWLGVWLPEAGLAVQTCRPHAGESPPGNPSAWGALVVLGGVVGAYDDGLAPWLPRTRALLAAAVAAGIPTLGVCLGAQLLAAAAGGGVAPGGAGPEVGLVPLRLT
ncbi:MAG TPA: gamma-glutamyl-gamma-aminobutyrate hydrolase family protein, partial [Mycobacteriales bacterium]|nr:gamma-glutamyl-gamma-aminobutyrate hydrolase family protein [Mycobacteriales bacterium]